MKASRLGSVALRGGWRHQCCAATDLCHIVSHSRSCWCRPLWILQLVASQRQRARRWWYTRPPHCSCHLCGPCSSMPNGLSAVSTARTHGTHTGWTTSWYRACAPSTSATDSVLALLLSALWRLWLHARRYRKVTLYGRVLDASRVIIGAEWPESAGLACGVRRYDYSTQRQTTLHTDMYLLYSAANASLAH